MLCYSVSNSKALNMHGQSKLIISYAFVVYKTLMMLSSAVVVLSIFAYNMLSET